MGLFSERQRETDIAQRETDGENVWSDSLPESVRWKLWYDIELLNEIPQISADKIFTSARRSVVRTHGVPTLAGQPYNHPADLRAAMLTGSTAMVADILEAIYREIRNAGQRKLLETWGEHVSGILRSHRISFAFIDGRITPFVSQEMHTAVVAPVVSLLSGRHGYRDIEDSYVKALEEIAAGEAGDAITDAGRALEQTLRLLGSSGKNLGDLLRDAQKSGLLGNHDGLLRDSILGALLWAKDERNTNSDSHAGQAAVLDDAWLMVHITGALILRLAVGVPRPQPSARPPELSPPQDKDKGAVLGQELPTESGI